jgi:hypothetical protein
MEETPRAGRPSCQGPTLPRRSAVARARAGSPAARLHVHCARSRAQAETKQQVVIDQYKHIAALANGEVCPAPSPAARIARLFHPRAGAPRRLHPRALPSARGSCAGGHCQRALRGLPSRGWAKLEARWPEAAAGRAGHGAGDGGARQEAVAAGDPRAQAGACARARPCRACRPGRTVRGASGPAAGSRQGGFGFREMFRAPRLARGDAAAARGRRAGRARDQAEPRPAHGEGPAAAPGPLPDSLKRERPAEATAVSSDTPRPSPPLPAPSSGAG